METSEARRSMSPASRGENRLVLLMPILGKNGVTVPRRQSVPAAFRAATRGGRWTRRRARIYETGGRRGRREPRRPGGHGPASPAEISVHSGVNEPISSGKRSPWTNGI